MWCDVCKERGKEFDGKKVVMVWVLQYGGMSVAVGHVWCDLKLFKRKQGPAVTWRQVNKSTPQQRPLLPSTLHPHLFFPTPHPYPFSHSQTTILKQHHNQHNQNFAVKFI